MKVAADVLRAIDAERVALTTLLSDLVAIPTENPPATGYAPCVARIESALAERGLPFERIEIPSPADAPRAAIRAWVGSRGTDAVLPRALRRRPRVRLGAVHAADRRRHALWPRQLRHEERAGVDDRGRDGAAGTAAPCAAASNCCSCPTRKPAASSAPAHSSASACCRPISSACSSPSRPAASSGTAIAAR